MAKTDDQDLDNEELDDDADDSSVDDVDTSMFDALAGADDDEDDDEGESPLDPADIDELDEKSVKDLAKQQLKRLGEQDKGLKKRNSQLEEARKGANQWKGLLGSLEDSRKSASALSTLVKYAADSANVSVDDLVAKVFGTGSTKSPDPIDEDAWNEAVEDYVDSLQYETDKKIAKDMAKRLLKAVTKERKPVKSTEAKEDKVDNETKARLARLEQTESRRMKEANLRQMAARSAPIVQKQLQVDYPGVKITPKMVFDSVKEFPKAKSVLEAVKKHNAEMLAEAKHSPKRRKAESEEDARPPMMRSRTGGAPSKYGRNGKQPTTMAEMIAMVGTDE